ncbi:MAG: SDR family oxidoreductase [Clostridia bacterium]|nr:SDR family oxidoreductase [Clostridia bacterium]
MKTVLISGGSRGIGRAMVELFASRGYAVAFTYKSSEVEARELAERVCALAIRADSTKESEVESAVKTALASLGHIDCLINNAAVSSFSLFTDLSLDVWNETLGVSLTGAFLYSRAVIPSMIARKQGRIINISSMWGIVGSSCEVHYSAAKAGLIGFTKALAQELGPSGITVNAICPGVIDTDMNKALTEDDLAELAGNTPLMRIGRPEEVAAAAYFLASDEASFITGDVMNISGGYIT